MRNKILSITRVFPSVTTYNTAILFFRVMVSIELILAHGLKKIGVGVPVAEVIPNPFALPESINASLAIASNLVFPLFVIFGVFTRLAVLPILAVTLSGYFVVHFNDSLLEKDMPYMYSISYLLILIVGSGKYSIDYWINKFATKP
ncbi:MAG: DoxX family protein [Sphingobacteriales bacterium]|nr:DoxX family protein [Sphingobacteriales bacterium]